MAKKILIVEDETDTRSALVQAFRDEGFEVLEAADGHQGLTTALAEHPDLILLDIILPTMSGIIVLDRLVEDEWGKTAKVILLTALEDMETMSEVIERGAYDYFVKSNWKLEDIVKRAKEKMGV